MGRPDATGEVGTAECEHQQEATTLSQTVSAAHLIPVMGILAVEASGLQEMTGTHQEATIKEILGDDEAKEDDPDEGGQQEENFQPGELATWQLTENLTIFSCLT